MQTFDPCVHQMRQLVIKAAILMRQVKGLPPENNITTLYNEMAPLLGMKTDGLSSRDVNHLPAPHEIMDKSGMPLIPRKPCTACGMTESMELMGLCRSCKDSESGKYKSAWKCNKCGHLERSEKHMVQWFEELNIDFGNMPKQEMGIKTITDDGIK